jgi:hypothetical protein
VGGVDVREEPGVAGQLVMVIFFRQDSGQPVWPLGADGIDGPIWMVLHFAPRRYCGLNASGIY